MPRNSFLRGLVNYHLTKSNWDQLYWQLYVSKKETHTQNYQVTSKTKVLKNGITYFDGILNGLQKDLPGAGITVSK